MCALLTGILTLLGMAPPLLMSRLINQVARDGAWGIFPLVMTLLFLVPVLRALVNIGNSIIVNNLRLKFVVATRTAVYRHALYLSLKFYDEMPVGNITQRVMTDVVNIAGAITTNFVELLSDTITILFAVVVMLWLSRPLSLLTLALLPGYYYNYRFFSQRIKSANVQLRANMDHISSMLQERLNAHELIQSYGQEKAESLHFSSQAKQVMDSAVRGSAYSITFNQISAFINKVGNTLIYCAGCYFFIGEKMTYGEVVAFCSYATLLLGPLVRVSTIANEFTQAGIAVERIHQVLDQVPTIRDLPDALPINDLKGDIIIERMSFGYRQAAPILDHIDSVIAAGNHVAVVGAVGSGRTTLARLLRRFYEPQSGQIKIDGIDIRHYRLHDYQKNLALVLSESAILDGTIHENLVYGNPQATEPQIAKVVRSVGLDDLIAGLPEGYRTRLGSGGVQLAVGDRQRLGIARALLSNPLLLIIDEATASLDAESAQQIHLAIRQTMKNVTCIVVVHRLLIAKDADLIVVLNEGKIVEQGQHDQLLKKSGGLYRMIYGLQYGREFLPAEE